MKFISLSLFLLFFSLPILAQDITGQWNGILKVQGTQLRLVFHVSKSENGLSSKMDSPDQGAKDIQVTNTTFENSKIKFEILNAKIEYNGELIGNEIVGIFKQGNQKFPLNLSKESIEKVALKRPQEPKKPYSYISEEVVFQNTKDNISLSGTLTLPINKGLCPVVILISGSGPQDRNEEIMGHKPFLVISDYLTQNGIGVLRYDDRGVGESKGDFKTSTSADFATDVESAISYLKTRKEINKNKIGLIGHSEGGLIAPIVASKSSDIAFIIMLAGPGIQGDQLLLLQQKLIGKVYGLTDEVLQKNELTNRELFKIVNNSKNIDQVKIDLRKFIEKSLIENTAIGKPEEMSDEDFIKLTINQIANPWMYHFIKYNPIPTLEKIKCPVLALNGGKDLQVPAEENLEAIKKALNKNGNKNLTAKIIANLNHLFQECKTGSPDEYESLEETFSNKALTEIFQWIQTQTN